MEVSGGQGSFPWEVCALSSNALSSRQPSWIVSAFEGLPQAVYNMAVVDSFAAVEAAVEDDAIAEESFPLLFRALVYFFQIS